MPTWAWIIIVVGVVALLAAVAYWDRAREARRHRAAIKPLPPTLRERYAEVWQAIQAQFVRDPRGAVRRADALSQAVMADCGYPVWELDRRAAALSVERPAVVEHYREGRRLAQSAARGGGSNDELRRAMRHYGALLDELVQPAADEPTTRERRSEAHDTPAR